MWGLLVAISKVLLFLIISYALKTYVIDDLFGLNKTSVKSITTSTNTKPTTAPVAPPITPVDIVRQNEKTLTLPKGAVNNVLKCTNGFINSVNVRTGDRMGSISVVCSNGETSKPVGDVTSGTAIDPLILKNGFNKITIQRNPTIMNSLVIGQTVIAGKKPDFYPNKVVFDLECKEQAQKIIGMDVIQNGNTLVGVDAIYCKVV